MVQEVHDMTFTYIILVKHALIANMMHPSYNKKCWFQITCSAIVEYIYFQVFVHCSYPLYHLLVCG